MNAGSLVCLLTLGALAGAHTPALASTASFEIRERVGYAYDLETNRFLYTENHYETLRAGEVIADIVTYRDPSGRPFARKHVDYGERPTMPDFRLHNFETGHIEGAERRQNGVEVAFRELDGRELRRELLRTLEQGVIDAGFDRFIERNWDALTRGEALTRSFLVPGRLEYYDFRITRVAGGGDEITFALEPDTMLIRLFAPRILVTYALPSRRLLRYEGVSNLRDAAGDNYQVRIVFPDAPRAGPAPD
ncbi:MAG: hypothetical protein R3286_10470 [Gammaproteobacteria bacterium]|nr:hypothetical protein [Gammaproteobacteria bacterium]